MPTKKSIIFRRVGFSRPKNIINGRLKPTLRFLFLNLKEEYGKIGK